MIRGLIEDTTVLKMMSISAQLMGRRQPTQELFALHMILFNPLNTSQLSSHFNIGSRFYTLQKTLSTYHYVYTKHTDVCVAWFHVCLICAATSATWVCCSHSLGQVLHNMVQHLLRSSLNPFMPTVAKSA